MGARVSWYLEGYIIQVQLEGVLSHHLVWQVCRDIQQMLTIPPPGTVNILIDSGGLDDIHLSLIDLVRITRRELPRDAIARVVVYANTSSKLYFLLQTMAQTNQLTIRQVKTLDDALHYLRLRDKRLFMLDIDPSQDNKEPSP
jgi:hypothetical protein